MRDVRHKAAIGVACLALAAASLPGCGKYEPTTREEAQKTALVDQPWNDLGNGMYSFSFDESWPAALVKFREDNPELVITAMYGDRPCSHDGSHSHGVVIVTSPSSIFPAVPRDR